MINEKPHYGFAHVGGKLKRKRGSLFERLSRRLDKSGGPSACWPFIGSSLRGYGQINNGSGKAVLAHRVAYELANGPFDSSLRVCHRCDNPPCCNPAHLFLGTDATNASDKVAKGRAGRKLTWADAELIRVSSESTYALGRKLGVTRTMVGLIRAGKNWKVA
jgi:hypothetical protein